MICLTVIRPSWPVNMPGLLKANAKAAIKQKIYRGDL